LRITCIEVLILFLTTIACVGTDTRLPPPIAITHVTVVDVEKGLRLDDQTVLLIGNQISAVAPSSSVVVKRGATVVNGRGKFLIPGLWDMHTHVIDPDAPGSPETILPLFIAEGITGIRDMGSASLNSILQLRADVRSGRRIGPRMVVAGKVIDGAPAVFPPDSLIARTPDEGQRAVDGLLQRGVDFIKSYEMLQPEVFRAIVEEAKRHKIALAGHVPLTIDAGDASDLGMRSFEHLRNIDLACSSEADGLRAARTAQLAKQSRYTGSADPLTASWSAGYGSGEKVRADIHAAQRPRALDTEDPVRCTALIARFARNSTWQCVTLFIQSASLDPGRIERVRPTLRYVPPVIRTRWERGYQTFAALPDERKNQIRRWQEWEAQLIGRLAKANVPLLAGTDESNPYVVPGFGLHEELDALVTFGNLTPTEALRAATLEPARYLGETARLGTVAAGKDADLLLLDADPLADIHNTKKILAVFANGRYFDRAALDQLLAAAERASNLTN
jgi:imidazolonepropionase-like amidohydrolase